MDRILRDVTQHIVVPSRSWPQTLNVADVRSVELQVVPGINLNYTLDYSGAI